MEKKLFILLFLTEFIPTLPSLHHAYFLIQQGKMWNESQAYCRANYDDLATIESAADMDRFQTEAAKYQSPDAWIGLYNDVDGWRWSYGDEKLGNFTEWYAPNPKNVGAKESCVALFIGYGWDDFECTFNISFMCFDERLTGNNKYVYYSNTKTWPEALSYCRTHHTDLAVVKNATENSAAKAPTSYWTWFGLFRDTWKWSDMTSGVNLTWAPGEPNNAGGVESCGYMLNNLAYDGQCATVKPFYCHRVIMARKVIKLKVQSNQDVNDPAVRAAILEKIRKKLEEHQFTNFTVKFKKQPDENVFYPLN